MACGARESACSAGSVLRKPGSKLAIAEKILVIRNDKIGDFTLALPSFALLKRALPGARLCALVPEVTRELAALSPDIDDVLIDPGPDSPDGRWADLGKRIAARRFAAAIVLYSTPRIGLALLRARVPYRLAPATQLTQLLYRNKLRQRRSQSTKPEYEYNLDLVRHYLDSRGADFDDGLQRPVLGFPAEAVAARRRELAARYHLDPKSIWIGIHPGHGGSANNLSVAQYADLANRLQLGDNHTALVTAGPGEAEKAERLCSRLQCGAKAVHRSEAGLGSFVLDLATLGLLIGGSTGPLHIGGALNLRTVMFFPRRRTSSSLRWQSLNHEDRRLGFMPPANQDERDMSKIDPGRAAAEIRTKFADLGFGGSRSGAD